MARQSPLEPQAEEVWTEKLAEAAIAAGAGSGTRWRRRLLPTEGHTVRGYCLQLPDGVVVSVGRHTYGTASSFTVVVEDAEGWELFRSPGFGDRNSPAARLHASAKAAHEAQLPETLGPVVEGLRQLAAAGPGD